MRVVRVICDPRQQQPDVALQRLGDNRPLLHVPVRRGGQPGQPGHRHQRKRRQDLLRRHRPDRRVRHRQRSGGHWLRLLDLDDTQPDPRQGHRYQWGGHNGQPAAARDRDPDIGHLRRLRQLHSGVRRDGPVLTEVRHRYRPGLLQVPVHRGRHSRQLHYKHECGHQGRHHRTRRPIPELRHVHQHLLERRGLDRLLPLKRDLGVVRDNGIRHRHRIRDRQLRVPDTGLQLDLNARVTWREHLLLERLPGCARHEVRDGDQQRHPHLRGHVLHPHRRQHGPDQRHRDLPQHHHHEHVGQRELHHRDR